VRVRMARVSLEAARRVRRRVRAPRLLVHAFAKKRTAPFGHGSAYAFCVANRAVTKGSGVLRLLDPYWIEYGIDNVAGFGLARVFGVPGHPEPAVPTLTEKVNEPAGSWETSSVARLI